MCPNDNVTKPGVAGAGPEEALEVNKAKEDAPEVVDAPLATISEVFSFAETFKTKLYLVVGLFWAMVAGLALPASIMMFSRVMGDISAIAEEGLDPVVKIVYTMMVLGVVSFVSETLESMSCLVRDECCHGVFGLRLWCCMRMSSHSRKNSLRPPGGFLVTAADDMTLNLKRKWFEAVVRQDMAYFDLQDVAGTSTIISTNGAKYKKGVAKKLGAGVQFSFTVLVRPWG